MEDEDAEGERGEGSELAAAVRGVGASGVTIQGYAHLLRFQPILRSKRYPELEETLRSAKGHATDWVLGGESRNLWTVLHEVTVFHGYFDAAARPLLQDPGRLGDAGARAQAVQRFARVTAKLEELAAGAQERGRALASFQQRVSGDHAALAGLLGDALRDASQERILTLEAKLRQARIELDVLYRTRDKTIVELVVMEKERLAMNVVACVFGFGIGLGVAAYLLYEKYEAKRELDREIARREGEVAKLLKTLYAVREDVACSAVLVGQLAPLEGGLAAATLALNDELAGWQGLTSTFRTAGRRIEAVRAATDPDARELERLLRRAERHADHLRGEAAKVQDAQLLPVKELTLEG